jgi:hypothetical protein
MQKFDDYGPTTDHPHDPRNAPDDMEELCESTLTALETARGFIDKAIRVLNREKYPDIIVTLAMDDAIVELGGVAPKRNAPR